MKRPLAVSLALSLAVLSAACSSNSTRTTRNDVSPPGGAVTRDTTPVSVPRDPEAPVWVSREVAPEWLANRATVTSPDNVVGHSVKVPGREAALSMARMAAVKEAALQIAIDVTADGAMSDTAVNATTRTGDAVGSSGTSFEEQVAAAARDCVMGSRIEDEYYERFWSPATGWSWKAHVLLRYDYQKSVSATREKLQIG